MSRTAYSSNFINEDLNPCIEAVTNFQESLLTQKCLDRELYNYSKCAAYFENYKTCKKFWGYVKFKRVRAGISPKMPTKEEREKIMKLKQQGIFVFSVNDSEE